MSIHIRCKSCGFSFRIDARFAGRRGQCPLPECRHEFQIPARNRKEPVLTGGGDDRRRPSEIAAETSRRTAEPVSRNRAVVLPVAESGLPKRLYVAASALFGGLILLIIAAVFLPERATEADAAEPPQTANVEKPQSQQAAVYQKTIRPFLKKYCYECHGPKEETEGVAFHKYDDLPSVLASRTVWEKTLRQIEVAAMPPDDHDAQPTAAERKQVVAWLDKALFDIDCELVDDPGRVTIRRLNRTEYNNTIRDLVGVDFEPAKDFPSDDVGYGFDNIGDVLSLPTLLMEKYLDAAEQIAAAAIVEDIGAKNAQRFVGRKLDRGRWPLGRDGFVGLNSSGEVSTKVEFLLDGEYLLRAEAKADQAGGELAKMRFALDGKPVKVFEIKGHRKPDVYEFRLQVVKGNHKFAAAFTNDYYNPKAKNPRERDRNLSIRFLEVQGPLNVTPDDLPATHRRIVIRRPERDKSVRDCSIDIFRKFATRAFRRPVTADELARLADLVEAAVERGDTFEQGVQIGMQAVLVSPHFLFRIENDDRPHDPTARHNLGDYELATRLSYFLWSSMPDDELFALADKGKLHQSDVLLAQVQRMLKDSRSQAALVQNFGRQWLNLRNLADIKPDMARFPTFSEELRADMLTETDRFFAEIIREDRSMSDFLDAKYTFVNERLATHYGIDGVKGNEFRRVSLEGTPRAGVLTQASILMLTSDPTKTKPVLRGKWILENILGTPPPEPPANVPPLEETAKANPDASLREQMALHRSNPTCASCHVTMDAIGFGFENFDAIGRWRDKDGKHSIDPAGKLPGGETFKSPAELIEILGKRDRQFARCVAEKLLTYAIGRGLEYYDKCAVDKIVSNAARNDYRFSSFVVEIVNSRPFLMRRGDQGENE
jgi:mono/diheme cytochrome c family protein